MRVLLFFMLVLVAFFAYVDADEASRLGPEERRTLLADADDYLFESRNRESDIKCARDNDDCRHSTCCNKCAKCACKRGHMCRCSERNELAYFLGICRL